ncbi:MAG: DUF2232 domain-containing protein [Candidatus Delongbacteria bacterium]|nr:DUF2232 domain-containing protein [Candidatus Delongbacteria bacterium]
MHRFINAMPFFLHTILTCLFLMGDRIPFLFFLTEILLLVSAAWLYLTRETKASIFVLAMTILVFILSGGGLVMEISYATHCFSGLLFGYFIHRGYSYLNLLICSSLIMLAGQIVFYAIQPELYQQVITEILRVVERSSRILTAGIKNPEELQSFQQIVSKLSEFYTQTLFLFQFVEYFFKSGLILLIFLNFIKKSRPDLYRPLRFSELSLYENWFWMFLLSLALQIIFTGPWFQIGLNLMMIILFCYFVLGISLIVFLIRRQKINRLMIAMLILFLIFFQPFSLLMTSLIGVSDYFMKWRLRINPTL